VSKPKIDNLREIGKAREGRLMTDRDEMRSSTPHSFYRPDIDGLRAFAVIAVVVFHAFPTQLPGGYIGVDVFFVISGFLITQIIVLEVQNERFSIVGFYYRRIRRIFPALLLVFSFCLIFGWLSLLPDEYTQLSKHVAAGAGFVSNFVLWNESGYFDNSAETKPLLHLWSLGIEEQFYLVWPLTILIFWKRKINLFIPTISLLLISFLINIYTTDANITEAFYFPYTRFWELLSGSVLSLLFVSKTRLSHNIFFYAAKLSFPRDFEPVLRTDFRYSELAFSFSGSF
jgi:peptidoglycan/LPS O-acetylase OafA/YrhL